MCRTSLAKRSWHGPINHPCNVPPLCLSL
jgi:hypothetical protein